MTAPARVDLSAMQWAERVSVWTAVPILGSVLLAGVMKRGLPLALAGAASLLLTLAVLARNERPRSYLPTVVTCVRAGITCLLIAFGQNLAGPVQALGVFSVFTLDGLDGLLARRLNSISVLGERMDMETDALLVMGTCTLLMLQGEVGPWVLTSGLLRYGYVLVIRVSGTRGEAPRSSFARYAFGLSLSLLTLGLLPVGLLRTFGPLGATLVLAYSFGRSLYWSFRAHDARMSQSNSTSEPSEK